MSCLKNSVKFTWRIIQCLFKTMKKTEREVSCIFIEVVSAAFRSVCCSSPVLHTCKQESLRFLPGSCAAIHYAEAVPAPGRLLQSSRERFTNAFSYFNVLLSKMSFSLNLPPGLRVQSSRPLATLWSKIMSNQTAGTMRRNYSPPFLCVKLTIFLVEMKGTGLASLENKILHWFVLVQCKISHQIHQWAAFLAKRGYPKCARIIPSSAAYSVLGCLETPRAVN